LSSGYLRTTTSYGGKATLSSMLGTSMVNELTAQFGTDDRLEEPNLGRPLIAVTGFVLYFSRRKHRRVSRPILGNLAPGE